MNSLNKVVFGIFICILFFGFFVSDHDLQAQNTSSGSFVFSTSLKQGQTSNAVIELQKKLNSDPETVVSLSGAGSNGQETAYFGALTRLAVIKFQNKYKSEVLSPAGLFAGTGFVGPLTIKKLNNMSNLGYISPALSSIRSAITDKGVEKLDIDVYATDKIIKSIQDDVYKRLNEAVRLRKEPDLDFSAYTTTPSKVLIQKISASAGYPSSSVTLTATGIRPLNTIYLASKGKNFIIKDVKGLGGVVTFTVPPLSTPGRYDLAVENTNGISNTVFFIITTPTSPLVKVFEVKQQKVRYGESITIIGQGFTQKNNVVITTMGTIEGISSSDGTSLEVTIAPESLREVAQQKSGGGSEKEFDVKFQVVNDNGYTPSQSSFKLVI